MNTNIFVILKSKDFKMSRKEFNIHNGCFKASLSMRRSPFYSDIIFAIDNQVNWTKTFKIYIDSYRTDGTLIIKVINGKIIFTILKSSEYGSRKYITKYTPEIKRYLKSYFYNIYRRV